MVRSAESLSQATASAEVAEAAAGDQDAVGVNVGVDTDTTAVVARLIEQVQTLLRESGNGEPFDAAAWMDRWLQRPNHALGGAAPELYLTTPQGEALLSNLIGAMAAGSSM